MNKKGFTLIELIATLVILGIVVGITIISVSGIFKTAKEKSEGVFISTIKDAIEMYLSSDAKKNLTFSNTCPSRLNKSYKTGVLVYETKVTMKDVISTGSLTQKDFVNPADEKNICNPVEDIPVTIYRDEDYVYYYSVDKDSFGCLTEDDVISNLPEGYSC